MEFPYLANKKQTELMNSKEILKEIQYVDFIKTHLRNKMKLMLEGRGITSLSLAISQTLRRTGFWCFSFDDDRSPFQLRMCKNLPFLEDRRATIKARQSVSIPLLNRKALREVTHKYHAFGLESEELVKKAKLTLKNIGRREDYSPFPYFDESGS